MKHSNRRSMADATPPPHSGAEQELVAAQHTTALSLPIVSPPHLSSSAAAAAPSATSPAGELPDAADLPPQVAIEPWMWRAEFKSIMKLALPTMLLTCSGQALALTDQIFLGHLGTEELAAGALANTYCNLMWFFLVGSTTALDTLGSQAVGCGHHTVLVTWCIAAFVVSSVLVVPFMVAQYFGGAAAKYIFGQSDEIADLVNIFCRVLIPGMWPMIWGVILTKYLQVQNAMIAPAVVTLLTFFLNIGLNALCIRWLGFPGAPLATTISRCFQCFMLSLTVWAYESWRPASDIRTTPIAALFPAVTEEEERELLLAGHEVVPRQQSASASDHAPALSAASQPSRSEEDESSALLAPQQSRDSHSSAAAHVAPPSTSSCPTNGAFHHQTITSGAGSSNGHLQQDVFMTNGSDSRADAQLQSKPSLKRTDSKLRQVWARRNKWGVKEVAGYTRKQLSLATELNILRRYFMLALPGGLMMAFEVGSFDVTTVFAGRLGPVAIASHSSMIMTIAFTFVSCPFAVATAASIRVGNLLGAGQPRTAKLSSFISVMIGAAFMAVCAIAIFSCRDVIGHVFTSEQDVITTMATLAPFAALMQVSDGIMGTSQGVLRGCGRQGSLMVYNLVGFWGCGCLMGFLLAFYAHMGLIGLWCGIAFGDIVTCILNVVTLLRVDWEVEKRHALALAHTLNRTAEEKLAAAEIGGGTGDSRRVDDDGGEGASRMPPSINGGCRRDVEEGRGACIEVVSRAGVAVGSPKRPVACSDGHPRGSSVGAGHRRSSADAKGKPGLAGDERSVAALAPSSTRTDVELAAETQPMLAGLGRDSSRT